VPSGGATGAAPPGGGGATTTGASVVGGGGVAGTGSWLHFEQPLSMDATAITAAADDIYFFMDDSSGSKFEPEELSA
jgi:hypothetical protein